MIFPKYIPLITQKTKTFGLFFFKILTTPNALWKVQSLLLSIIRKIEPNNRVKKQHFKKALFVIRRKHWNTLRAPTKKKCISLPWALRDFKPHYVLKSVFGYALHSDWFWCFVRYKGTKIEIEEESSFFGFFFFIPFKSHILLVSTQKKIVYDIFFVVLVKNSFRIQRKFHFSCWMRKKISLRAKLKFSW